MFDLVTSQNSIRPNYELNTRYQILYYMVCPLFTLFMRDVMNTYCTSNCILFTLVSILPVSNCFVVLPKIFIKIWYYNLHNSVMARRISEKLLLRAIYCVDFTLMYSGFPMIYKLYIDLVYLSNSSNLEMARPKIRSTCVAER